MQGISQMQFEAMASASHYKKILFFRRVFHRHGEVADRRPHRLVPEEPVRQQGARGCRQGPRIGLHPERKSR